VELTQKTAQVLFDRTIDNSNNNNNNNDNNNDDNNNNGGDSTWGLCYKFGTGPFVYFDQHRLTVGDLANVTALVSSFFLVCLVFLPCLWTY
jgi:hypothetical protein